MINEYFDHDLADFMLFNGVFGDNFDIATINPSTTMSHNSFVICETPGGNEEGHEENHEDCDSLEMTKKVVSMTRPKRDRSRTLVSERRRRGHMKEQLYELRSLVPNITKMDKASIIADAVVYVQDLQRQTRKLKEEIAILESSKKEELMFQAAYKNNKRSEETQQKNAARRKILRLVADEVGDQSFYVVVECNKGSGFAPCLYNAMESVAWFRLESSNFSVSPEKYKLTMNLNVGESREEMNSSSVKLWIMGALLKQGFEFELMAIT
ncbi:putative transcription factor bHLH family [Dioscorea sansibarensis]